jgi:hypothetical protein
MTIMFHNGTRIVAQPDLAASPAEPGRIVRRARPREAAGDALYGLFILQTVGRTVRSGRNASTVRNP